MHRSKNLPASQIPRVKAIPPAPPAAELSPLAGEADDSTFVGYTRGPILVVSGWTSGSCWLVCTFWSHRRPKRNMSPGRFRACLAD